MLNDDEAILVLVDEAHRSHSNCAARDPAPRRSRTARALASPGTPIIMGDKKRTHEIFGEFIDRYTLKESEADGATVPILYEGRTPKARSPTARGSTTSCPRTCSPRDRRGTEAIKRKHGTLHGPFLEARKSSTTRRSDMLRHYVENILPNGLKAQVVAYQPTRSRALPRRAHGNARDALVAEAERLDAADDASSTTLELQGKPRKMQAAVRAAWQLDRLCADRVRARSFRPITTMTPSGRSGPTRRRSRTRIASFKKPFVAPRIPRSATRSRF